MSTFVVIFAQPVLYQGGHPVAQRLITELSIHAPSAEEALIHAARVVQGSVVGARAEARN